MARYASDYDRWADRPAHRGEDPWEWGYGREEAGRWGYRPEAGWSRPEFNVSPGAFGSPEPAPGWGESPWEAGEGFAGRRTWGTGASWMARPGPAAQPTARQIMTENPESVTPDTTLAEVARKMRDLDVGIIPVLRDSEGGILEGVITDRDIAVRAAAEGKDMNRATVRDFMSRDVDTVRESATVREIFSVMKRRRVRRVPITDDAGRLVGIVAQADLAVDYAGLDLDRETEVEEVLERISEPARPRRMGAPGMRPTSWREGRGWGYDEPAYDREFGHRIRAGWNTVKRQARHFMDRGYDRPFS